MTARMVRAGAGLLLFIALALLWLALVPFARLRAHIAALGWRAALAGFGLRLRVHGTPAPRALLVANHISWIDIPALALLTGGAFVAKAEVSDWPLVGALARRQGCLFVERERRLFAADQAEALRERLGRAARLVLFPEGTTGTGEDLLPFRSSLFEAARVVEAACVQPVALVYRRADGGALDAAGRRRIAWLGDDALLPHAFALAAHGGAVLEVWFEAPVPANSRKAMAEACRAAIAARLAGPALPRRQAGRLKRAA